MKGKQGQREKWFLRSLSRSRPRGVELEARMYAASRWQGMVGEDGEQVDLGF